MVEDDGTPLQRLVDKVKIPLHEHDLSTSPTGRQREELASVLRNARHEPFDLGLAPLARACLVKLGAGEHVLQMVLHHLVCDGESEAILRRELSELYSAFCNGKPADAVPGGLGYLDFAAWENARTKEDRSSRSYSTGPSGCAISCR